MRWIEIIGEAGGVQSETYAGAREQIAGAAHKRAEASRKYQNAVQRAGEAEKRSRQAGYDANRRKQAASASYQQTMQKVNGQVAAASRALAQPGS